MDGRDRFFLRVAWVAGAAGVLIIAFAVWIPIAAALNHAPFSPEFFFFGVWGLAALCGCAACVHTYYVSGGPPGDRPPPGGLRERKFTVVEGGAKTEGASEQTKRAA